MTKWIHGAAVVLLATAACSAQESAEAPSDATTNASDTGNATTESANTSAVTAAPAATAEIRDPAGTVVGSATATVEADGLHVLVEAKGLPQGAHGAHVHTAGLCEGPKFESAGPHWNPTSRQHGRDNPEGAHLGDLPNLEIGADGTGRVEFTVPGGAVSGGTNALLDADGASIVIHAKADDYKTDPSGNSGDRVACGIFR